MKGKKLEGLAGLLDLAGRDLVICLQAEGPVGRGAGRDWKKNLKGISSKVEKLKGIVVECRRPSQREVPAVVRRCLESRGLEATAAAVQQIADFVGEDVGAMEDAAERLLLWLGGPGKVDEEQVERVVRASRFHSVFELTDAVGEGDTRTAVRVLHASFRQGETPLALLGQLARHLRNLVRVGGASRRLGSDPQRLHAELGLHPYVIKKCLAQSRRFGAKRLGQLLDAVARADVDLKSSRLPAEIIMERLVLELAGSSGQNR
ncbi:MAG: DNA polymerase III subunit delta [Deltaproteobacteria bacterium]|nr:MAG: DNA polymerase III subunit delta [Deltaproteobacteria bacterium]